MEDDGFPPPPPPLPPPDDDEEEGECFEFDDSTDEAPEPDRPLPDPPVQDCGPPGHQGAAAAPVCAPSASSDKGACESGRGSISLSSEYAEVELPRPPPTCPASDAPSSAIGGPHGAVPPPPEEEPNLDWDLPPPPEDYTPAQTGCTSLSMASGRTDSPPKASPYSVIDIAPIQQQQVCPQSPPLSPTPSNENEGDFQEVPSSPSFPSGYSVPVPCGYATPSSVPVIAPTYTTPVIIRHLSVDEDVTVVGAGSSLTESVFSEEHPSIKEEDALAKWVSDPANVAWMDSPDEVIYDDVPRENSDSTTDLDEMLYDDVEQGAEGCSSLDGDGWSSSEFESYDETSDHENGHGHNGVPSAFVRTPCRKTHLSQDLVRLKEHYERKVRGLMSNTVGTVELQQLKHKHEKQVQKLVKAAKHGTKDGLERTRAAVKKGRSFISTKSFCQERKESCFEEEDEPEVFIEVDCFNVEPVLCPAPEGLSQQQIVRRCILGSILESEKNYLETLKRILEQYEKPLLEIEPQLLSRRKCKVVFHRVRDIVQCHALFQMALVSRVADWDLLHTIGDVFVASFSKSMVLDAYSEYVNNFSTAMGVVRKACSSKPGFLEFLKQRQECSQDRLSLYGMMIKPIQRFPQFILLLQEMLNNTPVGHPDRLPLQMALTELETLAEKLDEKKREADQRCEIKHIAKAMNERYLNKLLSRGNRSLLRSDDVVETVYSERGEIIKTKERRLFLLSDVLMCATPNMRSPQDGAGGGVPSGQRFLLKWSVPLSLVELVEFGSSDEMGDSTPFPPHHSGEKVVINAKPNKLYVGPGQLYQDLQNLIHDLSLVNQICTMIGSLKGNYQNVNGTVAQDWVSGLQRLILKKEEEIRSADRCRIQLQLPGKQDKSGRPTFFSAVFNMSSPSIKQAWISTLQTAQLALEEDNMQGWFCAEDDRNLVLKHKHPLLLKHIPVVMSRLQEFKVECAVHNPEPHINSESTADMPAVGHGCVWVASCTNQMGQIAVVAMHNSCPKVTECFNVESRILCMAYVPLDEPLDDRQGNPEHGVPPRTSDMATVCVGLEEGSVCVYKSSQRCKKVRLQHFASPDRAAVTCLAYRNPCLYAGLVSGSLAIYSRNSGASWDTSAVCVLKLGVLPVKALIGVEEHVWASSGGQVFVINTRTQSVEHQLDVHQEEGMVVSHMVVAGVGIWIAFSSGSTLRLFHTETLEHLQDINIAAPINNFLSGQLRVSVSSLLVCHGLLLVGTNLGVTVALSVPRLQGIPKVTGRGMVSFHAHHGPVKFLTAATPVHNLQQDSTAPPIAPAVRDGWSEALGSDGAVWLGDTGGCAGPSPTPAPASCPAPVRRNSLSSSHSSMEHGPEDGAIYDLLSDPARAHGGKRAVRAEVSSLLVVSGGLGHRRVSRKTRLSRHEGSISTVMVWQIPVASP